MNVTVKQPDDLCQAARHRAIDAKKSLSAWLASLIERELKGPKPSTEKPESWIESLTLPDAPDWFYEREFPLEDRRAGTVRELR